MNSLVEMEAGNVFHFKSTQGLDAKKIQNFKADVKNETGHEEQNVGVMNAVFSNELVS